jgi:hypothetical protein
MGIINQMLEFIIVALDRLLPSLEISQEFKTAFDNFITFLIGIYDSASFFIPLDILLLCLSIIFIVDGFSLAMRVGQFVAKLIRG